MDLRNVDFSKTSLNRANLRSMNFRGANFRGAILGWADFIRANLSEADLSEANLIHANLIQANLDRANLSGAAFGYTIIDGSDLSTVTGLDSATHVGPSYIGVDAIYQSKGKISHHFLRGAGLPETFIEYMASLVGAGVEFYSLFISYSTKDQEFATRLHADLQRNGVRCWFAPHDIQGGKRIHEQIDAAIRMHDKLLLILSEHSMSSEWVKTEMAKARKRETNEGKQVLFPIRLCPFEELRDWECFDADTGKDSAREIREYFIPDFSNWKDHDSYTRAFDRLLKDLQGKIGFPATRPEL
jgi:hypothetical protein